MVEGFGVGWGYEISCVLSREGDVGAWVLYIRCLQHDDSYFTCPKHVATLYLLQ